MTKHQKVWLLSIAGALTSGAGVGQAMHSGYPWLIATCGWVSGMPTATLLAAHIILRRDARQANRRDTR